MYERGLTIRGCQTFFAYSVRDRRGHVLGRKMQPGNSMVESGSGVSRPRRPWEGLLNRTRKHAVPQIFPRNGLGLIALLELCFLEFATTSGHGPPSLFGNRRLAGIAAGFIRPATALKRRTLRKFMLQLAFAWFLDRSFPPPTLFLMNEQQRAINETESRPSSFRRRSCRSRKEGT